MIQPARPAVARSPWAGRIGSAYEALDAEGRALGRGAGDTRRAALGAVMDFDPEQYLSDDALRSLMERASVNFRGELAGMRGANERRGIRGPLASAREGDVAVAFDRNARGVAADFAGRRADLALGRADRLAGRADAETDLAFNTRGQALELALGERDNEVAREIAEKQERAARRRGLGAAIGTVAGAGIGFLAGGPVGAGYGAGFGGQAGAGFFG